MSLTTGQCKKNTKYTFRQLLFSLSLSESRWFFWIYENGKKNITFLPHAKFLTITDLFIWHSRHQIYISNVFPKNLSFWKSWQQTMLDKMLSKTCPKSDIFDKKCQDVDKHAFNDNNLTKWLFNKQPVHVPFTFLFFTIHRRKIAIIIPALTLEPF